jgi:hypothetical protein
MQVAYKMKYELDLTPLRADRRIWIMFAKSVQSAVPRQLAIERKFRQLSLSEPTWNRKKSYKKYNMNIAWGDPPPKFLREGGDFQGNEPTAYEFWNNDTECWERVFDIEVPGIPESNLSISQKHVCAVFDCSKWKSWWVLVIDDDGRKSQVKLHFIEDQWRWNGTKILGEGILRLHAMDHRCLNVCEQAEHAELCETPYKALRQKAADQHIDVDQAVGDMPAKLHVSSLVKIMSKAK